MPGFWMEVDGSPIHVNGDPNMSEETREAIANLFRAARKAVSEGTIGKGKIMTEELKPCAHCESRAYLYPPDERHGWGRGYRVSCDECGMTTDDHNSADIVRAIWNRRAADDFTTFVIWLRSSLPPATWIGLVTEATIARRQLGEDEELRQALDRFGQTVLQLRAAERLAADLGPGPGRETADG